MKTAVQWQASDGGHSPLEIFARAGRFETGDVEQRSAARPQSFPRRFSP
jgi:hypothetical protein